MPPPPLVRSSLFFVPDPPNYHTQEKPIGKEMRGDEENRETGRRVRRTIKPPHTKTTERKRRKKEKEIRDYTGYTNKQRVSSSSKS